MNSAAVRVLIVDDDIEDAELARDLLLESAGDAVVIESAPTYEAGLLALQTGAFDVCLVDFRLGARSGLDFLREPAVRETAVPVIVMTGHGSREVDQQVLEAGAVDFLSKDALTASSLERTVRYAVERRRRQRAEGQFRALVGNSRELVSVIDRDGTLRFVSPSIERVLGFAPTQKTGGAAMLEVHPDDRAIAESAVARVLIDGDASVRATYRAKHADGSWRVLDTIAENYLDDPDIRGVVLSSWDVTERAAQEEQIRFQANLLDAVGQAIAATDPEGRVIYWNRAAETQHGLRPAEAMGRDIAGILLQDASHAVPGSLLHAMRTGQPWRGACRLRATGGTTMAALINGSPLHDDTGQIRGVIWAVSDVSPLEAAERALNERIKELRTLYGVNRILIAADAPLERRLQRAVESMPQGWRYPGLTAVRLTMLGMVFESNGYVETPWKESAGIEGGSGLLEVVQLELLDDNADDPFLPEERELLDALAAAIGEAVRRDRTASELRRSEERFREISEHISHVFRVRTAGHAGMDYVSTAYSQVWGRSSDEVYEDADAWLKYMLPSDRVRMTAILDGWDSDGYEAEYRIIRPDGEIRSVHERGYIVGDSPATPARLIAVSEDITARKQLEQRFVLLSQHIADVIYVVGTDGVVLYSSPSVEAALGYTSEEFTGMFSFDLVHPDDREALRERFARIVARPGATARAQYRVITKSGEVRHVESVVRSLIDDPSISGVLITSRDVTERLDIEHRLRESQKLHAIGRLAGGVAHDFNNILTVIRSQTEMLLLDLPTGPLVDEIEIIQASADRAATLTAQLLAFSRDQVLRPQVVDLVGIVKGMDRILERAVGERVTIRYDFPDAPPAVLVDPAQVEQVVMNLAVNARDAMPDGGRLCIRIAGGQPAPADNPNATAGSGAAAPDRADGWVVLEVTDTGTGMPDDVRNRVFEPFYTTKPRGKGTGLGLAMAYGVVTQSGGTIEIDSTPGRGTSVRILFPGSAGAPTPVAPARAPADGDDELSGSVLVVEDDVNVRRVTSTILERAGMHVELAESAEAALDAIDGGVSVDVILTDLGLPGMSGHDLVDRLRQRASTVPLIVMSGYDVNPRGRQVELPQNVMFLQKPFTRVELLRAVRTGLAGP